MTNFIRKNAGAALDSRYALASQIPSIPPVYKDGVLLPTPKTATGFSTIASTGSFGTYSASFSPVVFSAAPRVIAWAQLSSGSNFVVVNLDSISTTGFTLWLMALAPGQVVVPSGQTVVVEWIAVGPS